MEQVSRRSIAREYFVEYILAMADPALTKPPARAEIVALLREDLIAGRIRPGALLSPAELAAQVAVSATPMREALIELASEGWLDVRPAKGFAVRELTVQEVEDLYPLVWTLEGLAIREVRPSAATLDALDGINARIRRSKSAREGSDLDAEWHALLVSSYRNAEHQRVLSSLKQRVRRYEIAYFRHAGALTTSIDQHAEITAALRERRMAAAVRVLEDNWRTGPQFLVPWLERVADAGEPRRFGARRR